MTVVTVLIKKGVAPTQVEFPSSVTSRSVTGAIHVYGGKTVTMTHAEYEHFKGAKLAHVVINRG